MDLTTLVGLVAGILTTIAFLPQVRQTWRTKSTKDISLRMFLTFCTGVLLWFIYGFMIHSLPVMLAKRRDVRASRSDSCDEAQVGVTAARGWIRPHPISRGLHSVVSSAGA